jgi:hypothetical protein
LPQNPNAGIRESIGGSVSEYGLKGQTKQNTVKSKKKEGQQGQTKVKRKEIKRKEVKQK